MDNINGIITQLRIYDEEGRTDWFLSLSKIIWFLIWILFPLSLFRIIYDLVGLIEAIVCILLMFVVLRLVGPSNLVMLDELLSRIAPTLRSPQRFGTVRVYDIRLSTDKGKIVACIIRGDLVGSSPMIGDQVLLEGRNRQGCFEVCRGTIMTTGALLERRPSRSHWVLITTAGLAVFFALYLMGVYDAWIYKWLGSFFEIFKSDQD